MTDPAAPLDPRARDRFLRRTRHAGRLVGLAAAGATALLSVVAANAFRGHDGRRARVAGAAPARVHPVPSRSKVPPPESVPAISNAPAPLAAPSDAPSAAAPTQAQAPVPQPAAPAPETSGGS